MYNGLTYLLVVVMVHQLVAYVEPLSLPQVYVYSKTYTTMHSHFSTLSRRGAAATCNSNSLILESRLKNKKI